MARSIKEAFIKASQETDRKIASEEPLARLISASTRKPEPNAGRNPTRTRLRESARDARAGRRSADADHTKGKRSPIISYGTVQGRPPRRESKTYWEAPRFRVPSAVPQAVQRPTNSKSQSPAPVPEVKAPVPTIRLRVSADAKFNLAPATHAATPQLKPLETTGMAVQVHEGKIDDQHQLTLGLDFGTSCVKVVIGDNELDRAFAVPLGSGSGIEQYLLPSRLYQTGEHFSLTDGTDCHRDLKLSLLADPDNKTLQGRVTAFLALVIRRSRGWMLHTHQGLYRRTQLFWKLALGLPAAHHFDSPATELFQRLGAAAWACANAAGDVSETLVQDALEKASPEVIGEEDAEVVTLPEIAAQIYGFVVSNSFDVNERNVFLMADIGAGTVDASLFHVKPAGRGKWDFEFYTSVVAPHGVSNLHRHRVNWWSSALDEACADASLTAALHDAKYATDQQKAVPESYLDYFSGVRVDVPKGICTPDEQFYRFKVLSQVQGKAFWRAWKDGFLDQSGLTDIPFFLCGGGGRMAYFRQLEESLASIPGFSWLKAQAWCLGVPDDLDADDMTPEEFDRLSVAYGLSRVDIGNLRKALPLPVLREPPSEAWRDNYVSKDLC